MRKLKYNNQGLSTIISVVLLILVAISAVMIVAGVIIPFVKNSLIEGGACVGAINKIEIDTENREYTCVYEGSNHESSPENVNITRVKVSMKDIELEGIIIVLYQGGKSVPIRINGSDAKEGNFKVRMYQELNWDNDDELPSPNGALTYEIREDDGSLPDEFKAESVSVFPIIDGQVCDVGEDKVKLPDCKYYRIEDGLEKIVV